MRKWIEKGMNSEEETMGRFTVKQLTQCVKGCEKKEAEEFV